MRGLMVALVFMASPVFAAGPAVQCIEGSCEVQKQGVLAKGPVLQAVRRPYPAIVPLPRVRQASRQCRPARAKSAIVRLIRRVVRR